MAHQTAYHVILMDCDLPIKDGWQATREIRDRERRHGGHGGRRVPILAVTANAMRGDRERCLDAGMDGYLAKSVQRISLLQMMGFWYGHTAVAKPRDPTHLFISFRESNCIL